ncbi:putative transporter [Neonectria ditissima]|uniref:Putative transporter n=1 Tax=Neonectria ditissima TaxID=78410 RepID=A0A0P7BPA3_9HYPO|nr:putative transporter [Neonectria ditissima]
MITDTKTEPSIAKAAQAELCAEETAVRDPTSLDATTLPHARLVCSFNGSLGTSMPSGAYEAFSEHFSVSDDIHLTLLNSLNMAGFVLGPLLFGPLSEYVGRRPVLVVSFVGYVAFMLACSGAPSYGSLLVFRLLCGINGAAPLTVVGGLCADILDDPSQRGAAIAVYMAMNSLAGLVGPIISGVVSPHSWRWPFWAAAIVAAPGIPLVLTLPETYGPVLHNKRIRERAKNGQCVEGDELTETHPFDTFMAFLQRPQVWHIFQVIVVGVIIALCGFFVYTRWYDQSVKAGKPWAQREIYRRLPIACLASPWFVFQSFYKVSNLILKSLSMVVSLFWLGWTSWKSISPVVTSLGGIFFGIGFQLIFMSMLNYITDVFRQRSASAHAGASCIRSVGAVVIPLSAGPMFSRLGIHWASSLLGFLALIMGVIPFVFIGYAALIVEGESDLKNHSLDDVVPKKSIGDLAEPEDTTQPVGFWASLTRRSANKDLDAIATERSVFDNPDLAQFYQPKEDYENLHRFDPNERWTHREEQAVRRKTDLKIFLWILVMFFGLNIDRGNLGNAAADNLLNDLKINTNDYNNAQNMYRVGFLIAEIPSQMIGKRLGPDRWIPVQIMLWSLASGGQFFMHNRAGFFACRFFIGLFMGGFIPDSILYLSYFYKKSEMPIRLAFFWFVDSMSGVIASFMAYGILHMRGVAGREGWRWLFLLEALISFVLGALSFLFLVPGPTQTKTWWNPDGYFSEREEKIIVNRVLRDDPSKSDMHNREAITLPMLWKSLKDYDLWPVYLIGILFEIPTSPPKTYLTLSLKALGFSTFNTTLLVIPATVFAAVNMLWVTYLTERFHQIAIIGLLAQVWVLPLLVIEYTSVQKLAPWGQYALTFMILGQPSVHAAQVSWCSRLSNAVRTRAVSAALYNITIQLSGIASSNIYREDDKPHYYRGNKNLIGITVGAIAAYAFAKVYYTFRNKHKRDHWNKMTGEEKAYYLQHSHHQGNKRLDFLFDS